MTEPTPATRHPLRLRGELTEPLSRWLWLVKWFLLIPHYIVLVFLFIGVAVVKIIAFFAVIITGKYPEGLREYVIGVFRWANRVSTYTYFMTDAYPPFSLK